MRITFDKNEDAGPHLVHVISGQFWTATNHYRQATPTLAFLGLLSA